MGNLPHLQPALELDFLETALLHYEPWRLGNDVLYSLCSERPDHVRDDVIIAKFWLIGRAYAAAIERRKRSLYSDAGEGHPVGDEFYIEKVAPRVRSSDIDVWFDELRREGNGVTPTSVRIHKNLTELLHEISSLNKRSLASKYLHFHFEHKFFIYDSRAAYGLSRIATELGVLRSTQITWEGDREYAKFVSLCQIIRFKCEEVLGRKITPREIDSILVFWGDVARRSKRRRRIRGLIKLAAGNSPR
jgi:hypothetical protein